MTDAAIKDQIERAKKVDIMSVLDVKLLGKSGTRFRGECPICGSSKGQKGTGAFSVDPVGNRYHCFGNCNGGGDVIKLAQAVWRCSFKEAVEDLLNEELAKTRRSVAPAAVQQAAPETGPTSAERMATDFWRDGSPGLIGTLAEVYLRHRGLCDEIIALMDKRFRFHPAAKETWDKDQRCWSTWPAMIGRVATAGGFTGGVHVTYLARDGRGKARIPAAKRMWGPQSDKEGRPGGIWLTQPSAPGPLIVGEGIESTASAGQLTGLPCRMVATLSLNRLQGGCKLDKWGRMDLGTVQADPERPPFTWPEPKAAPWGEVLIAVDRDMNPVKVKIRKHGGGTIEHVLDAEARARICAGLAVQAWRAAGANRVRAIAPAAGRDFNTELQECVV